MGTFAFILLDRPNTVRPVETNKTETNGGTRPGEVDPVTKPDTPSPDRPDRPNTVRSAQTNKSKESTRHGESRSNVIAVERSDTKAPGRPDEIEILPPTRKDSSNNTLNVSEAKQERNVDPLTQPTLAGLSNEIKRIDDSTIN